MLFEKATRLSLRFASTKGLISVEDLWVLPLTSAKNSSLDSLAKDINAQLKASGEESFVEVKTSKDCVLQLKLDILKHIIKVRLEENKASHDAVERKAKKAKIMSLLADKQDSALANKSEEELQKMLADL